MARATSSLPVPDSPMIDNPGRLPMRPDEPGGEMAKLSTNARNLNWLVANFARATPGVSHARAGHCRPARAGPVRLAVDLTLLVAGLFDVALVDDDARPELEARDRGLEVLLAHPGGPFWRNKDEGAWTIPKGEFHDEDPLEAAKREFKEETGFAAPDGQYIPLTPIKQKNGKIVHAWAIEGDFDPAKLKSNVFEMEWPPKSGKSGA